MVLLFSTPYVSASSERDIISLTTFSTYYANSKVSSSAGSSSSFQLQPSIDMELSLRVRAIFNLTLTWNRFEDPDPSNAAQLQDEVGGFGLGMKIDLPGVFLIGGKNQDLTREGKKTPLNTFLFGEVLKLAMTDVSTGAKTTTTAGRGGFGADFFPFEHMAYLSFRFGIMNVLGVSYFNYAWGFGLHF